MERYAGSPFQARKGELLATHELSGFVAEEGAELAGFAGYHFPRSGECELAALFARLQTGIGTKLVEAVVEEARRSGARRLWLITTNDNIEAMRFYQRRGFRLAALYPGAVDDSRRTLKPDIPAIGNFGIPIRDEIEFEMVL